jgi:hypothetical protein
MSALKDQDSKEKEGQDRGRDPVKQFHEDRIFNKESELNIIAPVDAEEVKLMVAREEGSQEDYVAHKISHVEPDYEEVQLIFGWMKLSTVTPRLGLLITDTIYLFGVKSRCNTRHKATYTASLDTPTIQGVSIAQICYVPTSRMTEILELKQGMLEVKQEKRFVNSPGNGAVNPTENLIEKWGAPSKPTGDFQGNTVIQQESETACLPLIQNWQAKPRKYRHHPAEQLVQIATTMLNDPSSLVEHFANIHEHPH